MNTNSSFSAQKSGAVGTYTPAGRCRQQHRLGATLLAVAALAGIAALSVADDHRARRSAPSGPPGDFGDAPVGDVADGIEAYPGVLARWTSWYFHRNTVTAPVQHLHGTWLKTGATFQLGTIPPTATPDTTQTPNAPENDADPVIVLEALGPNPLAQLHLTVSTTPAHNPNQPFFLNVFVDQNRTGEWKDGFHLGTQVFAWDLEWVVQDLPIMMPPGEVRDLSIGHIRLANPTHSVWLRCIVSDARIGTILKAGQPFWDGTMIPVHDWKGEIEDHFLEYKTTYEPGKGIFPWWVVGRGNDDPPGGGDPKPACDAFYQAPSVIWTPWCANGWVHWNFRYRVTERDDGCDPGILWGMYGYKRLAGVVDPPTVQLVNPAFFKPGTAGMNTLTCPDGTDLTLPPDVETYPPRFQGHVTKEALRNGPAGGLAWRACYPTPRRFRIYRAFLEVMTCGSVHQSSTVRTGPPYAHNPSAIVAVGKRVDHVDWIAGDLIESFIDLEDDRPFPDPDFQDMQIIPTAPGGEGFLDEENFVSPPAAMRLHDAMFSIRPWMPICPETIFDDRRSGLGIETADRCPVRATGVTFSYFALADGTERGGNSVTLISTLGEAFTDILPDVNAWTEHSITLPEDFELDTIQVALANGWIDDIHVHLDEIVDCNGNGIHDAYDIASGTSTDDTGTGVPDECELLSPCDGYCGVRSPADCWCDEDCALFGDCCEDFDEFCLEPEPCPGDANGDGTVNVQDLLLVISNWGSTGPDGDVNNDGTVNVQDLLEVITNWGSTCP